MTKLSDLTNKKFGLLTVISHYHFVKRKNGTTHYWLCQCECGNQTIVQTSYLKSGHTKSCGCLKHLPYSATHGLSKTRLYTIWCNMKARCYRKKEPAYPRYGGRGIKICDEWLSSFENFYKWSMDNNYQENLSIDRIDVNGNYCPENCRWVDDHVQANNTRKNHLITYKGKTQNIAQWAKEYNLKSYTIQSRLKMGWSIERILTQSPDIYNNRDKKLIEYNDEFKTKQEWLDIMKCNPATFYRRLKKYRLSLTQSKG